MNGEVFSFHCTCKKNLIFFYLQCLEVLKCPCLQSDELQSLITILNKYLVNHFEKYDARETKRKEEDFDEVLEEILIKEVRNRKFIGSH